MKSGGSYLAVSQGGSSSGGSTGSSGNNSNHGDRRCVSSGGCCCCCCCWGHASTGAAADGMSGTSGTRRNTVTIYSRHLILPLVLLLLAGYIMTFDVSVLEGKSALLPESITKLVQRPRNQTQTVPVTTPATTAAATAATPIQASTPKASNETKSNTSPKQKPQTNNPSSAPKEAAPKQSTNKPSSSQPKEPEQQPKANRKRNNNGRPVIMPPPLSTALDRTKKERDYGGLTLDLSMPERLIRSNDGDLYETEKLAQDNAYANESDEEAYWGYFDHVDPTLQSVKSTLVTSMKPNCNLFYEQHWPNDDTVQGDMVDTIQYLASGYYRDTYKYFHFSTADMQSSTTTATQTTTEVETIVVKRQKFSQPLSRKRLERVRNEALAMELLTSSPRVTNAYGHCGFSILVEPALRGISNQVVPYYKDFQNYPGVLPQQILDEHPELLFTLNNLTAVEKLNLALAVTESMADIHGLRTGPLILMDVSLDQWLVTVNGNRIVLNDFDNSVFMGWRIYEERYSPYGSAHVGGFKAPEELDVDPKLDERSDVWKMGDVLYTLLTGLQPYYNELHDERPDVIDDFLRAGTPPHIDERYKTHGYIEGRLVEIMMQCFRRQPADRVDIFQVVRWLRDTKKQHEQQT